MKRLLILLSFALWSAVAEESTVPAPPKLELKSKLDQPEKVFAEIFASLPAEINVLPTEHYHYWQAQAPEGVVWGNLRFANGLRERGILSFGYTCGETRQTKLFSATDGVQVNCNDAFTVLVTHAEKTVKFTLHRLEQTLPLTWKLSTDETFVERTCDESGLQFHLIYRREKNHFLWVLDDTSQVNWKSLGEGVTLETRTGFVFLQEGNRYVLAAVSRSSVQQNDYSDGPFDQLADNYAEKSGRKQWMEKAIPECVGKIDAWGNYLNAPKPRRVAIAPYFQYDTLESAMEFISRAKAHHEPLEYLAKLGQVE